MLGVLRRLVAGHCTRHQCNNLHIPHAALPGHLCAWSCLRTQCALLLCSHPPLVPHITTCRADWHIGTSQHASRTGAEHPARCASCRQTHKMIKYNTTTLICSKTTDDPIHTQPKSNVGDVPSQLAPVTNAQPPRDAHWTHMHNTPLIGICRPLYFGLSMPL